jgi:two-component system response regulator FlrC
LAEDTQIDASDLLIEPVNSLHDTSPNNQAQYFAQVEAEDPDNKLLGSELKYQEHQIILDALQVYNGKRKDVAEKLGISPRTLRYKLAKMRESGIEVPN